MLPTVLARFGLLALVVALEIDTVRAQDAVAPSIQVEGKDLLMVAPEDGGKIVFQAGNNAAVDLTALVARVTDLEFRLKEANDKIDACELKTDTGSAAQQAADALALKTQQRIKDAETALSVLEGSVIKVQKVVSAMSECDKQGLHHGPGDVCTRSDSWSCPALDVAGGASSIKQEAFIGTVARVTCDDGAYLEGSATLTCLGSDSADTGAHWGLPLDGSAHEPKCKKCLSDCKTCSAATSCDTCPKADQVWNPVTKKCVVNKARSCKELLDRNQLPSIPSGKDHIDRAVELYPDMLNKPLVAVKGVCHVVREDDGKVKAYTSIPCDAAAGAGGACLGMTNTVDANTCTKAGYIAGPPRTLKHLDRMHARYGAAYFKYLPGVSCKSCAGQQSYNCVMKRSDPSKLTPGECDGWEAVGGGQWYASSQPSSLREHYDPGGDSCPDDLLPSNYEFRSIENSKCVDATKNKDFCAAHEAGLRKIFEAKAADRNYKEPGASQYVAKEIKKTSACGPACEGMSLYDNAGLDAQRKPICPNKRTEASPTFAYICSTKDY